MNRFDAIRKIRELVTEEIIVSNIGDPSKELFHSGDRPENFYMLGSMGLASSIGIGVSIANKRKVIVLDGDGSIFMNLGSLVTIAIEAKSNFKLVILDNASYGSTGYQETAISKKSNLKKIARAAGNKDVFEASEMRELEHIIKEALKSNNPSIIIIKVSKEHTKLPPVPIKAQDIKKRFMRSILDSKRHSDEK